LENRQLRDAAEILIRHQRKGLLWEPAEDGFVFSKEQVERHARLLTHQNPMYYDVRPQSQASAPAAT
jgi:hypothetical protein